MYDRRLVAGGILGEISTGTATEVQNRSTFQISRISRGDLNINFIGHQREISQTNGSGSMSEKVRIEYIIALVRSPVDRCHGFAKTDLRLAMTTCYKLNQIM